MLVTLPQKPLSLKGKIIRWSIAILGPPLRLFGNTLYYLTFMWWFEKRYMRRETERLAQDIRSRCDFLFTEHPGEIVPFDPGPPFNKGAVHVAVSVDDLLFVFAIHRLELGVFLARKDNPSEWTEHELATTLRALNTSEVTPPRPQYYRLSDVSRVLRPEMTRLKEAFSEHGYPQFARRLAATKEQESEECAQALERICGQPIARLPKGGTTT